MEAKQRYSPELAVGLQLPSDVQISPDGQRVAFVVAPIGHEETTPISAVWLADTSGAREPRRFTAGEVEDRMPRWSPDGQQLAFLSDRAERGTAQAHLIDLAGGEARPVTALPKGADLLAWAPDGHALYCTADRRALAGEGEPKSDVRITSLADRQRVIVAVPVAGDRVRLIGPAEGHVWAYAVRRDGRQIAALTTSSNRLDDTYGDVRLVLIDTVTHAERALAVLHRLPSAIQWSPDGSRLVVVGQAVSAKDDERVMVIDAETGAVTAREAGETTPVWVGWIGSESARLLTVADEGLYSRIEDINSADGTAHQLQPVPAGGRLSTPLSLSSDGTTLALIRQQPSGPPEVWAGPRDGELRCLTHLNPQLDGVELAPMEPIEWPTHDGLTIQGWLLRPPGVAPTERLPLIVDVHGGPSASWGATFHATWHDWGQILAAAGYAVLLPNPRGSTGRGATFTAANRSDLGGMDFDDIMRGVDWLIERGVADPDRLGIAGWSYGGFLTAWAVTHTDRFKAAVCGAAVTNWPSKVGTTDIRPYNEDRFPGPLHEAPDALWERSPVRYLRQAKTPTLIVHGDADQRVPVSQGLEFFLGLRAVGVPTDFIVYPRQKHAFHERAHQLDLLRRIVAWFDRYLRERRWDA